jgi:hypothetical protein
LLGIQVVQQLHEWAREGTSIVAERSGASKPVLRVPPFARLMRAEAVEGPGLW